MAESGKPAQVFIVEDNDPDVFLFEEAMRSQGLTAQVQRCQDGEEAIRALSQMDESRLPDIIVIDLNLPKVTGLEILKHVRSLKLLDRVPVMILTSSQSKVDRTLSLQLGADAYIAKPPTLPEFLSAVGVGIRRLLERLDSGAGTRFEPSCTSRNIPVTSDVCWYDRGHSRIRKQCSKSTISRRVTATLSRSTAFPFARTRVRRSGSWGRTAPARRPLSLSSPA